MSTFRSELVSICIRVSAAAIISYVSIKYIVRFMDPNYNLKCEARKKVEALMQLLDIDFPVELNEYELRIATQLVTPNMGVDWSQVGGYETVISELQSRVIKPLHARANGRLPSSSSLLTPARGILLYGPPGCGKTLIARAVAKSAGARFIQLDLSSLTDKWYGESQKLASAVFSLAKKIQPCIIFIDEIDAFLRIRQSSDNEATAMMKAQFMSLWDGFDSGADDSAVIVLGATNRPTDLDSAILRRMPTKFFIQLPNEAARAKIIKTILRNEYVEADIDYAHIAQLTRGSSGSDLKEICRLAALMKLEQVESFNSDEWVDPLSVTIGQNDLIQAVVKYSSNEIHSVFSQMIVDDIE